MDEEELGSINVELRYISLELMKIAENKGLTFEEVAGEYVRNVKMLHKMINSDTDESLRPEELKKSVFNKL